MTYFSFLMSVFICRVYAEMTCQTVQEKTHAQLSCEYGVQGDVTWSRDQDGKRVKILTLRKGQDKEEKHIADPGKRYNSGADRSLIIRVTSSDSGIYYCNDDPVVNLTVTSVKVPVEDPKRTCVPYLPTTQEVTISPTNEKSTTTEKKKKELIMRTMTVDDRSDEMTREDNKKRNKDQKKHGKNYKNKGEKKDDNKYGKKDEKEDEKEDEKDEKKDVKKDVKEDVKENVKDVKTDVKKGPWQVFVVVVVATGLLVLVLVGFFIRRRWFHKGVSSHSQKQTGIYCLAGAEGTQGEVIPMTADPIYYTIQRPKNMEHSNVQNPYSLAQHPENADQL